MFMGSILSAMNDNDLKNNKITHIVNLVSNDSKKLNYKQFDRIKYYNINIPNSKITNLSHYINDIVNFVNDAINNNANILIHCIRGISRSGAIIVACLVKIYNFNIDDAINITKSKRHIFKPNDILLDQLYKLTN